MSRWDDLRHGLNSADPEAQGRAIDEVVTSVEGGLGMALDALERGPNRFLIAERLSRLGGVYVSTLEHVFHRSSTAEVRDLVALLLLRAGSSEGEDELLCAIRDGHELAELAAMTLARRSRQSAVPVIGDKLRTMKLEEVDRVVAFLTALEILGQQPPAEFVERVAREGAAWQIQTKLGATTRMP